MKRKFKNEPVSSLLHLVGALLYGLDIKFPRKSNWGFGLHELFHIFVMLGSFSHFWFVMNYLI